MPQLIHDYFHPAWRTQALTCDACEWHGDSRAMTLEPHRDQSEYACPQCEDILLVVQHPSLEQVRAAAEAGNAEAREQLDLLQQFARERT